MEQFRIDIDRLIENRDIVLLGAGQLGQMALDLWPSGVPLPKLFLDESRKGSIRGIPIENTLTHVPKDNNFYVLCFFKVDIVIVKKLFQARLGADVVTIYDLLTFYLPDRFSNGWVGDLMKLKTAITNIPFFADEKSQLNYKTAIDWRYSRKLHCMPELVVEHEKYNIEEYFGRDLSFDFIIDGGAYDLSFPIKLRNLGCSWDRMIAYEPDFSRHEAISHILLVSDCLGGKHSQVELDQRAIWSNNQGCAFYANGLLSARIARSPDASCIKVPTVTLNEVIRSASLSSKAKILIKLHVEGAEWPIIENSLGLLEHYSNVSLLINISHDEDSFLKIPFLLAKLARHSIYLRCYSLFGEGLTLVALPR